jgi:hypothetical protein
MRTLLLICALAIPAAHAATCNTSSGDTRARLLELYTSEGCSSCPPADRWLSQLPQQRDLVPLAFHVDYWDRLGWKDPFAQAAFSQRQRARNSGLGWVYTPQLMLDGADFRGWSGGLPEAARAPAQLVLDMSLSATQRQIDATVTPHFSAAAAGQRGAQLYFALTENRLVSNVAAGENASRTLRHDHVVRELAGPFDARATRHRFVLSPEWNAQHLAVVAFVLDSRGRTLQALAGACPG